MAIARPFTRRNLLSLVVAGVSAAAFAGRAGKVLGATAGQRWIELANTHTGETLGVAYRSAGALIPEALAHLQHLLRDHRVDEEHAIDPALYDQLADLAAVAGVEPRFEVISGYRSARTNAELARPGSGVATHSLHIEGRAIDVRLIGCRCDRLRDLALDAARGGVGYYQHSDFVHLDTGRPRAWTG